MVYLANTLIANAYYDADIVSREFETVSGEQMANGVLWLNEIITEKRVDKGMIPYETKFQIPSIVGQETYWIPNLIALDTIVFYLQDVRYSMEVLNRNQYFGNPRVENIQSLPSQVYFERKVGGGNLHIYFQPDRNYPLELHGYFDLNIVSQFQDLSANVTTVDLGIPTVYGFSGTNGSFSLSTGQFVVSIPGPSGNIVVVDLMGTYPNLGALVNYINSGILPGVSASINVNDLILSSNTIPPKSIYVQTTGFAPNGTQFISSVVAATTTNLVSTYYNGSLNNGIGAYLQATSVGPLVIDGITINVGDIVLVKDQTNPVQNGLYVLDVVGLWQLVRTTNYDQAIQIGEGNLITATNGAVNSGDTFVQTADVSQIGTSSIVFTLFNTITFSNFPTIQSPSYQIFNPSGFDQFFISYLEYALADRLCTKYNYVTPPNVLKQKSIYEAWINKQSRNIDLTMQKVSTLQQRNRNGLNWAQINIGRGYSPY